jgi:hypothetical protein
MAEELLYWRSRMKRIAEVVDKVLSEEPFAILGAAEVRVSIAELRIAQANNDKTKLLDLPRLPRPHMNLRSAFGGKPEKHLLTSRLTGFDPDRTLSNVTKCGRCFSEKDLYGYRQGAISVTTGPPPLDATHRPRLLRLLGHASRWNTASASIAPSESNQCRQTHSLTSPWGSRRFNERLRCP